MYLAEIPEKLWQMSSSTIGELNTPEGLVLYAAVIVFGSNTVSNVPLVLLLAPEITNKWVVKCIAFACPSKRTHLWFILYHAVWKEMQRKWHGSNYRGFLQ